MPSGQLKDINTRMSFVIPKELKDKLDEYAKQEDRSTSKIICYAIKEYLDKYAPVPVKSQADTQTQDDPVTNES